jgi:hypothetical protein
VIVLIGRLSVALGIIVSLITISTGLGSKKAIQERVADQRAHYGKVHPVQRFLQHFRIRTTEFRFKKNTK